MLNQIKHSEITLRRCRSGAVSETTTRTESGTLLAPVSGTARRAGITIIEVLTAMVVAMIGVFGVMILIPFAVRQAQVGLDLDHANRVAQNGMAHFEMAGMQIPTRWQDGAGSQVTASAILANVTVAAIDPLQISYLDPNGFTQDPRVFIPQLTLTYPVSPGVVAPYDEGMARAMFRTSDDLQFGERISELGPPQQIFDSFAGTNVRRQFRGAMSWMSIVAPYGVVSGEPTNTFRMYTLVYKDRVLDPGLVEMDIREVQLPPTNTTGIAYSGGTIEVPPGGGPFDDARKGDWVMLFTQRPVVLPPFSTSNNGEVDIGFFKIASVPSTPVLATDSQYLTLDGTDFRFSDGTTAQVVHAVLLVGFQSGTLGTSQPKRLDHVVNVYERTFNTEYASSWNR